MATPSADQRPTDAAIEINPLNAAVAALFRTTSPETFAAVCNVFADLADDEPNTERFIEAVDRAQNLAEATGLIEISGQDAVQAIMARAFGRCRIHHKRSSSAPRSTVEALMLQLREGGAAALSDQECLYRLDEISRQQVREVIGRLIKLKPRYPAISDDLIDKLGELL